MGGDVAAVARPLGEGSRGWEDDIGGLPVRRTTAGSLIATCSRPAGRQSSLAPLGARERIRLRNLREQWWVARR